MFVGSQYVVVQLVQGSKGGQGKVNFDNEAEMREGSGLRQGVVWWSGGLELGLGSGLVDLDQAVVASGDGSVPCLFPLLDFLPCLLTR